MYCVDKVTYMSSESPDGSTKRAYNTIYWLFVEFVVLRWSNEGFVVYT